MPDGPGSDRVTLAPGVEVIIRPIRPEDRHLMTAGLANLSPQARYQRFFAPVERFSEADLTYLTEIDHSSHEALVAIDPEDGGLVGVARYVCIQPPAESPEHGHGDSARDPDGPEAAERTGSVQNAQSGHDTERGAAGAGPNGLSEAEVAVIVGDPWQGKGLGTALLKRLARRASEEGVDYFLALVLEENDDATELFERLVKDGSEVSDGSPGTVEIRIELPGPEGFSDSILARALSGSAKGTLKVAPWRRMQRRLARNRQRRQDREA